MGVTTLVIACAATAGWTRSLFVMDQVIVASQTIGCDTDISLTSIDGQLAFVQKVQLPLREDTAIIWHTPRWNSWNRGGKTIRNIVMADFPWRLRFLGFGYGWGQHVEMLGAFRMSAWVVSYWSIILPLTLLSAYLLLIKPRPKPNRLDLQSMNATE